jgi:hypothetical protein
MDVQRDCMMTEAGRVKKKPNLFIVEWLWWLLWYFNFQIFLMSNERSGRANRGTFNTVCNSSNTGTARSSSIPGVRAFRPV